MSVDLSGLEHFKSVLDKNRAFINKKNKNPKINAILNMALEVIKVAYSGKKVIVKKEITKTGFTIYVIDTKKQPTIAFEEFGTGFYAKGSYLGDLPTQTITFTSGGKKHSTRGWEYYYPNDKTKVTHGGIKGWMTPNGVFHVGQNANSTMYKACKKIIENVREGNF